MPSTVKKGGRRGGRTSGRSRVSSKHQITIPVGALREAGLREGDVVQVRVQGPGRVIVARMDDLIDEYAGVLRSGGRLGEAVRGLRSEWD
jgi:bifunctional DNA-binding transcriptional regulator/antitoxin component of YhaV-PrlF toxin-antitoxin module